MPTAATPGIDSTSPNKSASTCEILEKPTEAMSLPNEKNENIENTDAGTPNLSPNLVKLDLVTNGKMANGHANGHAETDCD